MESFAVSLQENLLVLLVYSDEHAKFIRNTTELEHYDGILRDCVRRVFRYIDDYDEPPKDHIVDLLEDVLEGDDRGKKAAYERVLIGLMDNKDKVSPKYTLDKLDKFIRLQNLKAGIMEAAAIVTQDGGEDAAEEAERILTAKMKKRLSVFDPGLFIDDLQKILSYLHTERRTIPTGIKEIDDLGLGPVYKGLHLFIGPPKSGKTTWFVQLGRVASRFGLKVCHVTLEMSEADMAQRYWQATWGISKRAEDINIPVFTTDQLGRLDDIQIKTISPKLTLDDPNFDKEIARRTRSWKKLQRQLLIKQFPTGQLSIRGLEAYLDRIEESINFVPDLLIVDYADLMQVSSVEHYRVSLGELYKQLRGIAVERNIAIATASQSNRLGVIKRKVTEAEVAEDFSKIATADCVITYNQTPEEKMLNLARLFVAAARHDVDKFEIVISQNYAMTQFCRDSVRMRGNYRDLYEPLLDK